MKIFLLLLVLFSRGNCFCQTASEIFLFDLKITKGQVVLSNGVNITKHKGYDNQPFFHPSDSVIFYSTHNQYGGSDTATYNLHTKKTALLTITHDKEYSPTVTPDGKFISCILQKDNGEQNLVQYPINGGPVQVLINHLKIGYHAWASNNNVLLFVLDDSTHFSLHNYYLDKSADTVIAENIGRSLHKIPGQNAMSFVQKISDKISVVKRFDKTTGVLSNIIYTLPGQDHLTWLQNNTLLMSDGSKIYYYENTGKEELKDKKWKPVRVEGTPAMLKGVTRLAGNNSGTRLAVVVGE